MPKRNNHPTTHISVSGQTVNGTIEKPSSRAFRDAWQLDPEKPAIKVNMEKARELKRDMFRRERVAMFEALDAEWFKAMETSGNAKDIADKKQRLRDVTKHKKIANAKTPEELEALKIEDLV